MINYKKAMKLRFLFLFTFLFGLTTAVYAKYDNILEIKAGTGGTVSPSGINIVSGDSEDMGESRQIQVINL